MQADMSEAIVELLADIDPDSVAAEDPRRWTRHGRPLSDDELARVCAASTPQFDAAGWLVRRRADAARDAIAWLEAAVLPYRAGREPWPRAVARMSPAIRQEAEALVDVVLDHGARYMTAGRFARDWATARAELGQLRRALRRASS